MAHAQYNPEWITQTFQLEGSGDYKFILGPEAVVISGNLGGPTKMVLYPTSRHEANQISMMLRKASRRMEEIGKGLE
jgi:hypothetical protein